MDGWDRHLADLTGCNFGIVKETRVKQAMDPTRVTAAVPTPSHPLQVLPFRYQERRARQSEACLQISKNKGLLCEQIYSHSKPVLLSYVRIMIAPAWRFGTAGTWHRNM